MYIQYLISHKQSHMSYGLIVITTTGQRLSVLSESYSSHQRSSHCIVCMEDLGYKRST